MKALIKHGTRDIRYEEVPDPTIIDDRDVIIKTLASGICGTDLHHYNGVMPATLEGKSEKTVFGVGHEAVGEVVEVGSQVRELKIGDVIMVSAAVGCGSCDECRRGNLKRCLHNELDAFGNGSALGGSQAEMVRVPVGDANSLKLPPGVSVDQAIVLTDNLPTAYAALINANVKAGSTVCVIGLGPIGLLAVETALLLGAARVFAVDFVAERRAIAEGLGAQAFDPEGAVEQIRDATHGRMCDAVVEAVGNNAALNLGMRLVGIDGIVSVLGNNTELALNVPFPIAIAGIGFQIHLFTEVSKYWGDVVPLIQSGRIDPSRHVTDRVPMSQGPDAYAKAARREAGTLKTILYPDDVFAKRSA
jgi:2-desacetyl-2-hydroxyethyl bacteriochlorophyllide A dehydrogenase